MVCPAEPPQPQRVIRCWGCEELLAPVSRDRALLIEADAELANVGGSPVIVCPCGARTIIPTDEDAANC